MILNLADLIRANWVDDEAEMIRKMVLLNEEAVRNLTCLK